MAPSQPNRLPPFPETRKKRAAGAVIVEPDGRVWLCEPTNHHGRYQRTFPKGTRDAGWSLEATAARRCSILPVSHAADIMHAICRGGDHPVEGALPSRLDEPESRLASGCNTSIA